MTPIKELALKLSESQFKGNRFNCLIIPGEQEVLRVEVADFEEIPIFITITEKQMLCIAYLFRREEVIAEKEAELNRILLELNVPMPLSAFSTIDDYYVIYGSLSVTSLFENVMLEVVNLASNSVEALEALEEFFE